MNQTLKNFGVVSGIIASVLCLAAWIWVLSEVGFAHDDDAIWTAISASTALVDEGEVPERR